MTAGDRRRARGVDYLYSDEDKVDDEGKPLRRRSASRTWSPERLRGQMYTCHLSVLRTSLVREVGGLPRGLRRLPGPRPRAPVTERARRVVHVPEVLYHWRAVPGSAAADPDAKPYAWDRRPQGRPGPPGPARDRGGRSSSDPCRASTSSTAAPRPAATRLSVVIPTSGSRRAGLGRAPGASSSRRSGRSSSTAGTTTSRSSWSTTPHAAERCSTSSRQVAGDTARPRAATRALQLQREDEPRVRLRPTATIVVLLNDDVEVDLAGLARAAWSRRSRRRTSG